MITYSNRAASRASKQRIPQRREFDENDLDA